MTHTHTAEAAKPTLPGRIYAAITAVSMTVGRGRAARLVATLAGISPDDRVMDIGCGPGAAVREAARRGAAATGIDPDPYMLVLARLISAAAPGPQRELADRIGRVGPPPRRQRHRRMGPQLHPPLAGQDRGAGRSPPPAGS